MMMMMTTTTTMMMMMDASAQAPRQGRVQLPATRWTVSHRHKLLHRRHSRLPAHLCGRPLLQAPQQKRLVEPSCRRSRPPRHALHLFPGHHRYRPRGALEGREGKDRASRYGAEPFAEARPMGRTGPSYLHLPSDGMGVHVTSIELGGAHTARCTHRPYNFFPKQGIISLEQKM